jgi:hypothetical protein
LRALRDCLFQGFLCFEVLHRVHLETPSLPRGSRGGGTMTQFAQDCNQLNQGNGFGAGRPASPCCAVGLNGCPVTPFYGRPVPPVPRMIAGRHGAFVGLEP